MGTSTIALEIDQDTAQAYQAVSAEERRQIQLLLNLRLRELTSRPARPLREIMDDIGREAAAQDLTPDDVKSFLSDD